MTGEAQQLATGLIAGDRRTLARCITRAESTRSEDRALVHDVLQRVLAHTGRALRLGITGTPGVGKSTFIDTFGSTLVDAGHKVAVLAIDPSSNLTGGSILGDKTRMSRLSRLANAYIRPSPSGGLTGGVARKTRDAMLLCEAAGFDVVIIETVGVGQSETTVAEISDLFLLLVAPGGGDDLQGIKRGIMELADVVAVNKSDGDLLNQARHTAADYRNALHLMRPKPGAEITPVINVSAVAETGFDELWTTLSEIHASMRASGRLDALRSEQAVAQLDREFYGQVVERLRNLPDLAAHADEVSQRVGEGDLSPTVGAEQLAELAFQQLRGAGS